MHVQQVERIELGHLGHARGQRQVVRRKLEQRITGDRNLVIEDAVVAAGEPEGLGVGDEVDFVAECGQLDAQLRGDHARAAVSGITRDADAHEDILVECGCEKRHNSAKRQGYGCFQKLKGLPNSVEAPQDLDPPWWIQDETGCLL